MRVEVTQEDIHRSRHCSSNCPIENALFRDYGYASVSRAFAWIVLDGKTKRFDLPLEASEFVAGFDDYEPVEPITFDMEESQ